jgi:hypothetical protein
MIEGADHDGVHVARQDARRVGDALAAAELHLLAGEHQGLAAELAHADIEGDAGAGGGLVEHHRQDLAFERPILGLLAAAASGLDLEADIQEVPDLRAGKVAEIEEMAGLH